MPAGRPLKFDSAHQINSIADNYFAECVEKEEPITITGLCIALGFTSRKVLMEYEDGKYDSYDPEFSNSVKCAKMRCEQYAESKIFSLKNPAGAIFALKNYGWTDKQEVEHSGSLNIADRLDAAAKRL